LLPVTFVCIDILRIDGDHPMLRIGLKISLISVAIAAAVIPLSVLLFVALALIGF
jgi:hypothetical protein